MNVRKPVIGISMGDYNGIGPEVILKAFSRIDRERSTPVVVGSKSVMIFYNEASGTSLSMKDVEMAAGTPTDSKENLYSADDSSTLPVLDIFSAGEIDLKPGKITKAAGGASMKAVDKCAELCMSGLAGAMVTAPISKEAIQMAGYKFPGHTEFLADKTNSGHFQMILVNKSLRVALATIHKPVRRIASLITPGLISHQLHLLDRSLRTDFGIRQPRIAVLSLNPHAGDGGVIGSEEIDIIRPALGKAVSKGVTAEGPFAADGFFGNQSYKNYDGILAMYHDQGLIPFKTLSFGSGVNFTAGLPIIRTSPDHGTGFDIAGKNKASEDSFRSAYELAVEMVYNKMKLNNG